MNTAVPTSSPKSGRWHRRTHKPHSTASVACMSCSSAYATPTKLIEMIAKVRSDRASGSRSHRTACTVPSSRTQAAIIDQTTVTSICASKVCAPMRIIRRAGYGAQRAASGRGRPRRHPPHGLEDVKTGVSLTEIARRSQVLRLGPGPGIVEGRDVDDRRTVTLLQQLAVHLDTGHAAQLDIDEQAAEMGAQRVVQEALGRKVGDGLKARLPQQPRQ